MQKCGFCTLMTEYLRKAMCIRSRRGSTESYYRELGDQETLKIDDPSILSDDSESMEEVQVVITQAVVTDHQTRHCVWLGRFLTIHKRRRSTIASRSLSLYPALVDDLQLGQVQCILRQSMTWQFNAFTLENASGGRCLRVLSVHLFHIYGLISRFNLDVIKTYKLFSLIEEGYHSTNPYHNSIHAADVTQAMHCFLQQNKILAYMEPIEIMASLLAAIAHDLDHPGVGQPFLISTSNHLAALYDNTSVLENHHWRSAISCIIESDFINPNHIAALQTQMRSLILATDITRQQEFLTQFRTYLDTNTLDLRKRDHRLLVLQIALKCADISNPCRPWEISQKWSLKVCEEFFRQGDYERSLNLPISPFCDRKTNSIPDIQTGFFQFVVTPLIKEWHRFLQNDLSAQMLENLLYNQYQWEALSAQESAVETRAEVTEAQVPEAEVCEIKVSEAEVSETVIDDDLETCSDTNISNSSELLLPLRRSSLNPTKPSALKEQLRRLSVPLNLFQDSRFKIKEKNQDSMTTVSHQESVAQNKEEKGEKDKFISTEKLLSDTSIASITTPAQAFRINTVLKEGGTWKLVRQQTFPPLESAAQSLALLCRPLHMSNEDAFYPARGKTEGGVSFEKEKKELKSLKSETEKTIPEKDDSSENNNVDVTAETRTEQLKDINNAAEKAKQETREPLTIGSQLRDNLSAVQLSASGQLGRRKSMPTDAVVYKQKEKIVRDVTAAIPPLLRTLSSKDCWSRRRGSAPAPVAPSELRGLASRGALHHSANGGRRKANPIKTCQQWLAKTTYNVQERAFQQLPRRSSLPAEVYHPTEVKKSQDTSK